MADEDLVGMVVDDIQSEGLDATSVSVMLELLQGAQDQSIPMLTDVVAILAQEGRVDLAAGLLKLAMGIPSSSNGSRPPSKPDYSLGASVLIGLTETEDMSIPHHLTKYLLEMKDDGRGNMQPDCTHVSLILGACAQTNQAGVAAKILSAIYHETPAEDSDDAYNNPPFPHLVPYVLGYLVELKHAAQARDIAAQLLKPAESDESDSDSYGDQELNHALLGWSLVQHVWIGRSDWAARIVAELEASNLPGFRKRDLMAAIVQCCGGDTSYAAAIDQYMPQARQHVAAANSKPAVQSPTSTGRGAPKASPKGSQLRAGASSWSPSASSAATSTPPATSPAVTEDPVTPAAAETPATPIVATADKPSTSPVTLEESPRAAAEEPAASVGETGTTAAEHAAHAAPTTEVVSPKPAVAGPDTIAEDISKVTISESAAEGTTGSQG